MAEKVFMFDGADLEMEAASQEARRTFRYFWRELAWEARRIVPALDMACVKAAFSDQERANPQHPEVEQMWVGDVNFDGQLVSGVLMNEPNWLRSIKQGDSVSLPLEKITDWMYAVRGEVYGAFTVNLMRSRMNPRERQQHDDAWGLNFGDPSSIRLVVVKKGYFAAGSQPEAQEHPMSQSMAPALEEQLTKNPSMLNSKDDRGWTLLHHQALAGSVATVEVLLKGGADVNAKTTEGMTPLQLAKSLGWDSVMALLCEHGAH